MTPCWYTRDPLDTKLCNGIITKCQVNMCFKGRIPHLQPYLFILPFKNIDLRDCNKRFVIKYDYAPTSHSNHEY